MNKKIFLFFYAILGVLVFVADRITKGWALYLSDEKIINKYLSFGLVFNRGINWGLLNSSHSGLFIGINICIALVILGIMVYAWYCWQHHMPIVGHILILAGALSNYFDRIYYSGVIDFIILSVGDWSWPAFNIADAAIVLGVGLILVTNYKKW